MHGTVCGGGGGVIYKATSYPLRLFQGSGAV